MASDWKEYQEEIAQYFRSLGCKAEVNMTIKGARAEHEVDVFVEFDKFGVKNKWIIECKYWNSRIPKEKVLVLKGIVEDVGADRGVIITEIGYQRGAKNVTESTNILLTTWKDFLQLSEKEFVQIMLEKIEKRLVEFRDELVDLKIEVEGETDGKGGVYVVPGNYFFVFGHICIFMDAIRDAKRGKFPVVVDVDYDGTNEQLFKIRSCEQLLMFFESNFSGLEDRVKKMKNSIHNRE